MFTIQDIINTLNDITVRGKDNMDKLLGCILALEAMQEAQNNASDSKEKEEEEVSEDGR